MVIDELQYEWGPAHIPRVLPSLVGQVGASSVAEKQLYYLYMAIDAGIVQRCYVIEALSINFCTSGYQFGGDL